MRCVENSKKMEEAKEQKSKPEGKEKQKRNAVKNKKKQIFCQVYIH